MTKDYQKLNHPIVVLVRGLPGSGKSYIASRLVKAIGPQKTVELDPDQTDYESREYKKHVKAQLSEGVDKSLHAYRFLRAKAYKGIEEDKIIIWNQPFTNLEIFHKMIGRFEDHAAEHNKELAILVVGVEVDPAIAKQRIDERRATGGHGPSDNTFERFVHDNTNFDSSDFNNITIQGNADINESLDTLIAAINQLV